MHFIDIILIGGAIACFSIAFFIASKPIIRRKGKPSDINNRGSRVTEKKPEVTGEEVFHVLHDETQ